jgi:hypothetical protein
VGEKYFWEPRRFATAGIQTGAERHTNAKIEEVPPECVIRGGKIPLPCAPVDQRSRLFEGISSKKRSPGALAGPMRDIRFAS